MNKIEPIPFGSDYMIRETGVRNVSAVPPVTVDTGSCTARLFHNRKDDVLTADVSSGTTIPVERIIPFKVGDLIYVMLNTGVWHDAGLLISKSGTDLEVTNAIPSNARAGLRVAVKIGPDVAMPTYGTPVLGAFDWGYGGIIEPGHDGLVIGMEIRIETTIAADGARSVKNYKTQVIGGA